MITGKNNVWRIADNKAYSEYNNRVVIHDTFVETGIYNDDELELVWQCKKDNEMYWDNLPGAPTPDIRANFMVRQLCRLFTGETFTTPIKPEIRSFQERVNSWAVNCFGVETANNLQERNHRFLEESLELVQATGCTKEEAYMLVDYVYGRPVGEPFQEVGGVMVTLAVLCVAAGLDMQTNGETELSRVWTMIEKIRAKQASRPKYSPLPQ